MYTNIIHNDDICNYFLKNQQFIFNSLGNCRECRSEVEQAIREAAEFGDGFWKIFQRLRHDGKPWNHKKVYRVYKQMHYEKRSKLKKKTPCTRQEPSRNTVRAEHHMVN